MSGRSKGVKMTMVFPPECRAQIDELAEKMHISCTAVVRMAIARWYYEEPAINGNGKRSDDGDDHAGLSD